MSHPCDAVIRAYQHRGGAALRTSGALLVPALLGAPETLLLCALPALAAAAWPRHVEQSLSEGAPDLVRGPEPCQGCCASGMWVSHALMNSMGRALPKMMSAIRKESCAPSLLRCARPCSLIRIKAQLTSTHGKEMAVQNSLKETKRQGRPTWASLGAASAASRSKLERAYEDAAGSAPS